LGFHKNRRESDQGFRRCGSLIWACSANLGYFLEAPSRIWFGACAGLGNSPRTILEELTRIRSNDVVLPTTTHGQIRLRCVTQPDPAQAALLDRLGIVLPKRMRLAEHELPALAVSA
jgi:hypothetical protein